jgi:hypothetical protein
MKAKEFDRAFDEGEDITRHPQQPRPPSLFPQGPKKGRFHPRGAGP